MNERIIIIICLAFVLNLFVIVYYFSYFIKKNNSANCYDDHEEKICDQNDPSFLNPHVYCKRVDFRIIILTMDRPDHLLQLLHSVQEMEMDGDELVVEIWIDRNASNILDQETLEVSRAFSRSTNYTSMHTHSRHAGLHQQWISTYSSEHLRDGEDEIVLFLEDDLVISRFSYRWLKAVHEHYKREPNYLGTTLSNLEDVHPFEVKLSDEDVTFMYRMFSTHAFSPKISVWRDFQRWFASHYKKKHFKPYVLDLQPTIWYKEFEKSGMESTMWSIWMIYYTFIEQLFSIYVNPNVFRGNMSRQHSNKYNNKKYNCLCSDGHGRGLHYEHNIKIKCRLVDHWSDNYIRFPKKILKIEWNGSLYES